MAVRNYLFALLFSFIALSSKAQNQGVIPSISEIIFPAQPEIRNNFNLLYEIHLQDDSLQYPSFWYKIIFNKDCHFEFTLFPIDEQDRYDFFLYKIEENAQFCEAYASEKIVSLNDYKFHKTYEDQTQSAQFRASMLHIKPIPVKAGDAIYLEVLSRSGKDCGHIFDCRTSESSLVTKVYNDYCQNRIRMEKDSSQVVAEREEQLALEYLGNLFCLERKKAIAFTSIKLEGSARKIKQEDDFLSYSKLEKIVKKKPRKPAKKEVLVEVKSNPEEEIKSQPISFVDSILMERAKRKDSLLKQENTPVKSTRDLNRLAVDDDFKTVYQAGNNSQVTRLEVDKSLFALLEKDLENKRDEKTKEIAESYAAFKKIGRKNRSKKREASKALKQLKEERKELEDKLAQAKEKAREIDQLIASGGYAQGKRPVFQKQRQSQWEEPVYKIQIGAYKNKISPETFKGLAPVSEDPYEGGVRYSVGAFGKLQYAREAKNYVHEVGLKDAFIVAYFKGRRISLQEALVLEL